MRVQGNKIIFSTSEQDQSSLLSSNLAKNPLFKPTGGGGGRSFEYIGDIQSTRELMFAAAPIEITIIFDSNITKVSFPDKFGNYGYWDCTESGAGWDADSGGYREDYYVGEGGTVLVTLNEGYVIDDVQLTYEPNDEYINDPAVGNITDTTFDFGYDTGMGGNPVTITITSKKATVKQKIDISTLDGWSSLATGDHSITIKTVASGYTSSQESNTITVSK